MEVVKLFCFDSFLTWSLVREDRLAARVDDFITRNNYCLLIAWQFQINSLNRNLMISIKRKSKRGVFGVKLPTSMGVERKISRSISLDPALCKAAEELGRKRNLTLSRLISKLLERELIASEQLDPAAEAVLLKVLEAAIHSVRERGSGRAPRQ